VIYNPEKHHRRSIRLKGHDYSGGGCYFVTICAHRQVGNVFAPDAVKKMVAEEWELILSKSSVGEGLVFFQKKYSKNMPSRNMPSGDLSKGSVGEGLVSSQKKYSKNMPSGDLSKGTHEACPYMIMPDHFHALIRISPAGGKSLGDLICAFKSRVVHRYIREVKCGNWPPFQGKIWHRNYYEVIVRSLEAEEKIAKYIRLNPWKCSHDFGGGLKGIGNPVLWQYDKLGVLCSRNAPKIGYIPEAEVYFGGWHSPKEKEILNWLLQHKKRIIICPAWRIDTVMSAKNHDQLSLIIEGLEENRLLILEMPNQDGDLIAAEVRNRFIVEHAEKLFMPHINKGGMLERILNEFKKQPAPNTTQFSRFQGVEGHFHPQTP